MESMDAAVLVVAYVAYFVVLLVHAAGRPLKHPKRWPGRYRG